MTALTFLSVVACCSAQAQSGSYLQMESQHFRLVAHATETDGRQALNALEAAHDFFRQHAILRNEPNEPLNVFGFVSQNEYAAFAPHQAAAGHFIYQGGHDYIAVQNLAAQSTPVLLHEYTHAVIRHTGYRLPLWLSEGIADYYSSIARVSDQLEAGAPLPFRLQTLAGQQVNVLDVILTSRAQSTSPRFYAASWALTHLLITDPAYAAAFPDFLRRISQTGADDVSALGTSFRKTPLELQVDLDRHIASLRRLHMEASAPFNAVPITISPLSSSEWAEATLTLQAAQPWTRRRAEAQLRAQADKPVANASTLERLGLVENSLGETALAHEHLTRAAGLGRLSPDAAYQLFLMDSKTGTNPARLLILLETVVESDRDNSEAALNLAVLQFNQRHLEAAAQTLAHVRNVDPRWAATYQFLRAHCPTLTAEVQVSPLPDTAGDTD